MAETFLVRATKRGQRPDGRWVGPGAEFSVTGDKLSARWMEVVEMPEEEEAPSDERSREDLIAEAISGVPQSEYTQSGKPEVDAINALGQFDPIVTAAERDAVWAKLTAD